MVRIKNLNPYFVYQNTPQKITWSHFKNKTIYEFEIILPLNAITHQYNGRDAYLRQCARVVIDQDLHVSKLLKDQLVLFDFPLKTFSTAWQGINYLFRKELTDNDNVRLKFEKINRETINIISYVKMQPTEEHIKFSKEHYVPIKTFNGTVVKEKEIL